MAIPYRTAGQGYSGQTQAQMYYARKRRRAREGVTPSEFKHVMPLGFKTTAAVATTRVPFFTWDFLGLTMAAKIDQF